MIRNLQPLRQQQQDAWDAGQELTVEELLADLDEGLTEDQVLELIYAEICLRQGGAREPQLDEYLRRFPDYGPRVRRLFEMHHIIEEPSIAETIDATMDFECPPTGNNEGANRQSETQIGAPSGQDTSLSDSRGNLNETIARPAAGLPRQFGDFEIVRRLGKGGMGEVFEARHQVHGTRVALKLLPNVDGAALHRFKREFRALADTRHPNLIGLHALEFDADTDAWFFTMDIIEGADFLSYCRPNGQLDEQRVRSALSQLITGAKALHQHGIVHRDLKPANVMVNQEGRVIVLDFGLVLESGASLVSQGAVVGTPVYMSPQQADSQTSTNSCDWYAVGVMLYEALSGRVPFEGSLLQVLKQKTVERPPDLTEDDGPGDLRSLAMRLLEIDPANRPGAAEINEFAQFSGGATANEHLASNSDILVGREKQMSELHSASDQFESDGEPLTVFVSGRSGEGKTCLIEHFMDSIGDRSYTVLSGRCYDRESVPFKALDNLLDTLSGHLRSLSDANAALLMPDDIGFLAHLFPVLDRVRAVSEFRKPKLADMDRQQVRQRAHAAFRSMLNRISRRRPIVMFIDDLQWGDADSAEVLYEVLKPPEAPLVLFLGSYRSDEAEASPFLQAWDTFKKQTDHPVRERSIEVSALTFDQCLELVEARIGEMTASLRERARALFEEAGGNPFFVSELIDSFDLTSGAGSIPLQEVIAHRLQSLPDEAVELLNLVAVAGQASDLEELMVAAGQSATAVPTLSEMRKEKLIRLVGSDVHPKVDTYHDKIRETTLASMPGNTRKSLHQTLADTIEERERALNDEDVSAIETEPRPDSDDAAQNPRLYDLAYHFDAAGDRRRGCVYALLAAEQARRQFALEVAAEQYAIAKRNLDESNRVVRFRIAEGFSESLIRLGEYQSAVGEIDGAVDLTDDVIEKARINALEGELAFKQGAVENAISHYEEGLRRLGLRVPKRHVGFVWRLVMETLRQTRHALSRKRLHRREATPRARLTSRMLHRTGATYSFHNVLKGAWCSLTAVNRAEKIPPSPTLAAIYAQHSTYMHVLGWHSRGSWYCERSIEMAEELDDQFLLGYSYGWAGAGQQAGGLYEPGIDYLRKAIDCFERTGDEWERNFAKFHLACCYYGAGDLRNALTEVRSTYHSCMRIRDTRAHCSAYLWAKMTQGDLPFEALVSEFPPFEDDILSGSNATIGKGHWLLNQGRLEEAVATFEQVANRMRKNIMIIWHTMNVLPSLTRARRLLAESVDDAVERKRLLKKAAKTARWAIRFCRIFPTEYPVALREAALVFQAQGRLGKALRCVNKSCQRAEKFKAQYEYVQSALVRAELHSELGRAGAEEQIKIAQDEIAPFLEVLASTSQS